MYVNKSVLPSEYDFGQEHKNLNTIIDRLSVTC